MSEIAKTRLVCQGFTKAAWIQLPDEVNYQKISATEFSCTFTDTVIQSQAVMGYANSVVGIRRTKGPWIDDVPVIDLSLSFEIHRDLLKKILEILISKRNRSFKIKLTDHATKMTWEFEECYLTSFSFSVSENTILSVSISFFVYIEKINYSWEERESYGFGNESSFPVQSQYEERGVIPYYDWKLEYKDSEISDVMAFNFSFTQNVEPKYECLGTKKKDAPPATNLLFGMPQLEFSWTLFKGGENGGISYRGNYDSTNEEKATTFHDTLDSLDDDSIVLSLRKPEKNTSPEFEKILQITGCWYVSATPTWDTFPSVERKFLVDGILKKPVES